MIRTLKALGLIVLAGGLAVALLSLIPRPTISAEEEARVETVIEELRKLESGDLVEYRTQMYFVCLDERVIDYVRLCELASDTKVQVSLDIYGNAGLIRRIIRKSEPGWCEEVQRYLNPKKWRSA